MERTCTVVWARVDGDPGPTADLELLSEDERARAAWLQMPGDQRRYVAAAALLRRVVGAAVGIEPASLAVQRTCPRCGRPHGRPVVRGSGLHVSVTHAGNVAGVAVTAVGPVGLDVEAEGRALRLPRTAYLGPGEHAADDRAKVRYWTRKEAVVKATGDGVRAGLAGVLVSGPEEPARLREYPGRPGLAVVLQDLACVAGYAGSLAVLTDGIVDVAERVLG